ncbi:MAG: hypothetical protein ACIALR_01210 [Blastopirellula sp. JB062]
MNPLVVAPLAIGAAGVAAHSASRLSNSSFGQLLSLGEKNADPTTLENQDDEKKPSSIDSLFASSGELSSMSLNDLGTANDNLLQEIEKALRQLMQEQGINPSSKFEFSINDRGEIEVEGAGTASEALSQAINRNATLSNKIRQAAANRSLMEAAAKHQEFSAAYNQDPHQSIDAYQALFDDQRSEDTHFTFRAAEGLTLDLV